MSKPTIRTKKNRKKFLEELEANNGDVSVSSRAVSICRSALYDWRRDDETFASAWDDIVESGTARLEREAYRRAHDGVDEPQFYQGEVCGYIKRYSDSNLQFLLRGRRPEMYRDNSKVELGGAGGGPAVIEVIYVNAKTEP